MYWLVLFFNGPVVIPEKYLTIEACKAAGETSWNGKFDGYRCIIAGEAGVCQQVVAGTNLLVSVPCSSIAGKP